MKWTMAVAGDEWRDSGNHSFKPFVCTKLRFAVSMFYCESQLAVAVTTPLSIIIRFSSLKLSITFF